MSAPVLASLFARPAAAAPAPESKPLFGRPASWLCFGPGINRRYLEEQARLAPTGQNADVLELADVAFCYLLTVHGREVRLQCPALGIDEKGDFEDVWFSFDTRARAEAARLSGHGYFDDLKDTMLCEGCVTTAWQGETRARICNVKVA